MAKVKVIKGKTVKVIPEDYLKDYIVAGWSEYKDKKVSYPTVNK